MKLISVERQMGKPYCLLRSKATLHGAIVPNIVWNCSSRREADYTVLIRQDYIMMITSREYLSLIQNAQP